MKNFQSFESEVVMNLVSRYLYLERLINLKDYESLHTYVVSK